MYVILVNIHKLCNGNGKEGGDELIQETKMCLILFIMLKLYIYKFNTIHTK